MSIVILIMLEIMVHVDQLWDMCTSLVWEPYLGAVRKTNNNISINKKLSIEQHNNGSLGKHVACEANLRLTPTYGLCDATL